MLLPWDEVTRRLCRYRAGTGPETWTYQPPELVNGLNGLKWVKWVKWVKWLVKWVKNDVVSSALLQSNKTHEDTGQSTETTSPRPQKHLFHIYCSVITVITDWKPVKKGSSFFSFLQTFFFPFVILLLPFCLEWDGILKMNKDVKHFPQTAIDHLCFFFWEQTILLISSIIDQSIFCVFSFYYSLYILNINPLSKL